MIYVTHDQVEAMTMGDRIVVMNQGRVQQVGAPLEIYERPANRFVAGFIGSPQMNFIEGELAEEGGRFFFNEAGGAVRLEVSAGHRESLNAHAGKKVTLGVRPEDFKEVGSGVPDAESWRELAARVDVVEPMGSEVYWYLKTGAHALVARLEPHARATAGEEKRLAVNMAKAHFFDPESEACIV
jgi:multiple sugar transport system ATP-binding protein